MNLFIIWELSIQVCYCQVSLLLAFNFNTQDYPDLDLDDVLSVPQAMREERLKVSCSQCALNHPLHKQLSLLPSCAYVMIVSCGFKIATLKQLHNSTMFVSGDT